MSITPAAAPPELVKFELLDEIGHGGMATVYRARDVRLGREVAVKLIHPHLRENKEVAARFIAEARAVAKLRHPGIVEVYDVSDAEDKERYLVAQLVRGPSLRKLILEHPQIPPEVGACFGVLLSDALAHAHDAGIVHRDVKPENVLVEVDDAHGEALVKLTDFGIAKVLDAQSVTSTGQVLGSPAHMAPEQIEGGEVDVRADVFSLGVLVYECMAGRLPFEGKNPAQVLKKVLECHFPPPDKARPTVGTRWSAILRGAIAREPADRYPTIRQFGEAMRSELAELGIEDARTEIYRYLSDPDGYAQAFVPALVASLIARAQRSQKSKDVPGAAADLNRAVAYRPDDGDLLRQVNALAQGQWRRQALNRGLWAMGAVVILAAATPLGVRAWKRRITHQPPVPVPASADLVANPTSSALPPVSVSLVSSTSPSAHPPGPVVKVPPLRPFTIESPKDKERKVVITSSPNTAYLSIDRGPAGEVGMSGQTRVLTVGPHIFDFMPSPDSKTCCDSKSYSWKVEPDDGSGKPQVFHGRLGFHDATVRVAGAPAGGQTECGIRRLTVVGNGSVKVQMANPTESLPCRHVPGDKSQTVVLSAGTETVVAWPP
ncbi:MAG: serine/threonine protein kinase [Deltaproteobacteria bacterium]|nr:serine/threonine protein kinase [Deltaproteobacteria bacterium]